MSEKYTIKIENFEGPLDLLFHLIEKNKMDIYDIPIALITEQYLEYLDAMQEMDLEVASEFLVMAATLLHIKSKMLLPKLKEKDEEADLVDPREELIARLLEYKKFKEFAGELKEREKIGQMVYYKIPDIIEVEEVPQTQLIGLSPDDLMAAFKKVLDRSISEKKHNARAFSQILHRDTISVATRIREIARMFKDNDVLKFSNLFKETKTKIEKIATFLAVLELIKLKRVFIEQDVNFSDIIIYKNNKVEHGEITEDIID